MTGPLRTTSIDWKRRHNGQLYCPKGRNQSAPGAFRRVRRANGAPNTRMRQTAIGALGAPYPTGLQPPYGTLLAPGHDRKPLFRMGSRARLSPYT